MCGWVNVWVDVLTTIISDMSNKLTDIIRPLELIFT